ncbi:hypothetical protein FAGKG844_440027 [Frankia sp. AgKG'84/4]
MRAGIARSDSSFSTVLSDSRSQATSSSTVRTSSSSEGRAAGRAVPAALPPEAEFRAVEPAEVAGDAAGGRPTDLAALAELPRGRTAPPDAARGEIGPAGAGQPGAAGAPCGPAGRPARPDARGEDIETPSCATRRSLHYLLRRTIHIAPLTRPGRPRRPRVRSTTHAQPGHRFAGVTRPALSRSGSENYTDPLVLGSLNQSLSYSNGSCYIDPTAAKSK